MTVYRRGNHVLSKKGKRNKQLLLFLVTFAAFGQSYAQFEMKSHTINSGGEFMEGGKFELKSSIGQADASGDVSSGQYSLNGGFWHQNNDLIFKNNFK